MISRVSATAPSTDVRSDRWLPALRLRRRRGRICAGLARHPEANPPPTNPTRSTAVAGLYRRRGRIGGAIVSALTATGHDVAIWTARRSSRSIQATSARPPWSKDPSGPSKDRLARVVICPMWIRAGGATVLDGYSRRSAIHDPPKRPLHEHAAHRARDRTSSVHRGFRVGPLTP